MTPQDQSRFTLQLADRAPVIPVLVIENIDDARPLGEALVAGGLSVLEVTLRTECALEAIARMSEIPGAVVGAGTVLTPQDVTASKQAGARFAVSPGATDTLLDACAQAELPLLPGAATASEAMTLSERGYSFLKFFPAAQAGGAKYLKSIGSPLPGITFCPTGGISLQTAPDYLSLSNIACVGGSWVAPGDLVNNGDWNAITALAQEASQLPR